MITRNELENVLSANTITRTLHSYARDKDKNIDNNWMVDFIEIDESGILCIYCSDPN